MIEAFVLHAALAFMPRVDRDNWWAQEGYDNREHSQATHLAFGYRSADVEVRLGYTGSFSNFLAFNKDDASYNRGENVPVTWGYNRQSSINVTAMRYFGNFGIGADLSRVSWTHARHHSEDGDDSRRFSMNFTQHDYTLGFRVGAYWGPLEIEYVQEAMALSRDGACCPPSKQSLSIGMRAYFR